MKSVLCLIGVLYFAGHSDANNNSDGGGNDLASGSGDAPVITGGQVEDATGFPDDVNLLGSICKHDWFGGSCKGTMNQQGVCVCDEDADEDPCNSHDGGNNDDGEDACIDSKLSAWYVRVP